VLLLVLSSSGCGSLAELTSPATPRTIAGLFRDANGPITGAKVTLTAYQDAECVALARRTDPPSDDDRRALRACARPAAEAITGEAGTYTFPNVRPGSYDLTVVWLLRPGQPVPSDPVFTQDGFAVAIVTNSDGTWTVTARSEILTLSGEGDVIQDFAFRPPEQ
jgi:hypothetical protein